MFLEFLPGLDVTNDVLAGSALGVLIGALLVVGIIVALAIYIYHALAWQTIARKQKYKHPWLAWIPFANFAMILSLGGFHWAWIFLLIIPVIGWLAVFILMIIAIWRIFEKRKYPGWFSLAPIIPKVGGILYLISIGFVAWKDKKK
ncbi:MAG: hypothetical protein KC516_00700 [Nanoarchaeota archaeon]|nr:hypothetical protein [Nanoarchaeota archaeon]